MGAEGQSGFEELFWRSAPAVSDDLPALSSSHIDDATFRLLADNIPTLCWIANGDGYIVWYNRRWHDYCGTTPEQMEGWGWQSVHDPALLPAVLERWTASIATGEPFEMTFPLRGADGRYRPFLTRIQPVRDVGGRVVRWFGVNTEISGQAAAEAGLGEREERLRLLIESAKDYAIITTDPRGTITSWSAGAQAIFGWSAEEAVGQSTAITFTPEDRAARIHKQELETAAREGFASHERWRLRKDGARLFMTGSVRPLHDAAGGQVGFLKVARDETGRRNAQEAAARLAALVSSASDGIISLAAEDGRITSWNKGAERLFGYAEAEAIGGPVDLLVPPRDQLTAEEDETGVFARAMTTGAAKTESVRRRKDGTLVDVSVAAARMETPDGVLGVSAIFRDITERKRAEAALRETEQRLNAVLDNTEMAIFLMDGCDRCVYANAAAEKLTGYAFAELQGRSLHETIHHTRCDGRPYPREECPIHRALPEGGRVQGEEVFVHKDGSLYPVAFTASPIGEAASNTTGTILEARNIAAEQAREAALAESEARFRTLANCMPAFVFVADAQGANLWTNTVFQQFTGKAAQELLGSGWLDTLDPQDREGATAAWTAAWRSGAPYRAEYRFRSPGGGCRWFLVRGTAMRGADGRISRWAGTCMDIQDIVEAREVLARSRLELEREIAERTAERDRMWRLSTDIMLVARFEGTIEAVNPAWTTLLGWTQAELLGAQFFDFVHPDDLASTAREAGRLADGLTTLRFRNRYRRKDGGYVHLSWTAVPEGGLIHAVGRDVTAEHEAAVELERAQEALRQAQKMEAVGQLTGGIAHDFNNMLAIVIGSLDLLGRRLDGADPRARRHVESAMEGARRAATLTQRLLAFSRQQPLAPVPLDANKLVAGMSDLLRRSLSEQIRLETVLAGGLWRVHADPNQLENAILNLAVNARDAMPEGGRLTIETANAHLDQRYASGHMGVPAGQYVLIAVSDTGAGMPADVIAKAFDPFFTTKEVGKGTGLGLSQVYGFVKQSGGHVKIYSELGQGTTVKIYLPRFFALAPAVDAQGEAPADLPGGGPREVVLVVEDEEAVRRFSVEALRELGYEVLEADGGAGALALLDAHPEIELLFTDVVMADLNGRKLADEALHRRPDLAVLFTTGYTRNAVVHNGVLDPGVQLLGKPFTLDELATRVRDVLDAAAERRGPRA